MEKIKKENEEISAENKKIHSMAYIRSLTRAEVLNYIGRLHKIIKKQQKKLHKYKLKLADVKSSRKKIKNDDPKITENKQLEEPLNFIDEIRQAAESAQNQTDFIYEPISGLYFDQKTGYYYNAECGLYYDGNSGCYYQYNQEKNEFVFHSRAEVQRNEIDKAMKHNSNGNRDDTKYTEHRRRYKKRKHKEEIKSDQEDGEIVSDSDSEDNNFQVNSNDSDTKYEDIAKKYPPSLRLIIQETNISKLKVGTLYIITYKGGTLGREGNHDVLIPDLNISKYHLKFTYNEEKSVYQCVDLGSRNGTILNGKRMSNAKQESELLEIVHGSVFQISQTKLLCHIHNGNNTCGHCEPGLLIDHRDEHKVVTLTHKEQLKKLQKRYGLENEKYIEPKTDQQYNDRAASRRDIVGSSHEHEKTQVASTEFEIPSENKGYKMLSKLGWNKGETLGKGKDGLLEPIPLLNNEGKKGLGCKESAPISMKMTKITAKKANTWKKAQERYKNLSKADIFCDSDDSV